MNSSHSTPSQYPPYTTVTIGNPATTTAIPFPEPDYVEFSGGVAVSVVVANDEISLGAAYQMMLKDYFKAKAENFPTWEGFPEIKQQITDPLRRLVNLHWYVSIPRSFVLDKEQKDEEVLWNS